MGVPLGKGMGFCSAVPFNNSITPTSAFCGLGGSLRPLM